MGIGFSRIEMLTQKPNSGPIWPVSTNYFQLYNWNFIISEHFSQMDILFGAPLCLGAITTLVNTSTMVKKSVAYMSYD